MRIEEMKSSK